MNSITSESQLIKSDFVLTPYMKSDNLKATYQVLNTLIPYFILWFLALQVQKEILPLWLIAPIIIALVLFSLRSFSLMHDCGHYSLFSSPKVNRLVGFVFGVVNAMPQYWWSRDHSYHHKTNGDWEKYRGIGEFLSTEEYDQLTASQQRMYCLLRHPFMIFPGGFFYLAFKPRLILITGIFEFIKDGISRRQQKNTLTWSQIWHSHRSAYWGSTAEFWDVLWNSVVVVSVWILGCHLFGSVFFLTVYSIVLTLSAASFISIFFAQHNFEGAYAHKTEGWDYILGAVEGSSFLEMPAILRWFTADISYHNIHHLSEKIPNYNLQACHIENSHLLRPDKTVIRLSDIPHCSQFILWDSQGEKLVPLSLKNYRNRAKSV